MAKQIRKQRAKARHYVKEWRTYRAMTQERLAEEIGRSRGLVSQIESGDTELTEELVYAMAKALRHTPGDVFRINPLVDGVVVDIADSLAGEPAEIQAEALGFVRGLVTRRQ